LLGGDACLLEGGGFDEVVDGFGLGEVEAAWEEGSLGEFAGLGEAGAGGDALAEEVIEEDGGAVGGDFYDVFRGGGVGGLEVGDDGFVECFSCVVNDFGEAGLGVGEGMAELQEGFGDGSRGWAGEANDADAAATGWGGDGDDGVLESVVETGSLTWGFFMLSVKKIWRGELWCFTGVFEKKRVQTVVFLWPICGVMHG
jgi:hypothetical protein